MKKLSPVCLLLAFFILLHSSGHAQAPLTSVKADSVQFQDADLKSVLTFLSLKAKELGASPSNLILYDPLGELAALDPRITFALRDIPLSDVIKYTNDLSDTTSITDTHAVLMGRPADLELLQKLRQTRPNPPAGSVILRSLQEIRVPSLSFEETPLSEALEFLRQVGAGAPGSKVPLNFCIRPGITGDPGKRPVTLNLADVSLLTALRYVTEMGGCSMRFDPRAIVIAEPGNITPPKPVILAQHPQYDVVLRSPVSEIALEEAPISEVVEVLSFFCKDPRIAPDGPNFILLTRTEQTVSLNLTNVRGIDLLRYCTEQTGTNFKVEADAIVLFDRPPAKTKQK